MRLEVAGGRTALLCYCANVHPGERLDDVWSALDAAAAVRASLGLPRMGLGLWLSRSALTQLGSSGGAPLLAGELEARKLEVTTMNGFPYGNFHAEVVKRAVYHPDWCTPERQAYSLQLAEILAALLPAGVDEATLSTLPIAHRDEVPGDPAAFIARACDALCRTAAALADLADRSGRRVRLCLEPEPGALLETTGDAIRWWTEWLPAGVERTGVPAAAVEAHLGLCLDTCHQAVVFEDPDWSLAALAAAEVPVGKVQLSSALEVAAPDSWEGRTALARFAEQRFLHQVRAVDGAGALVGVDDLYPDLAGLEALPADRPWRVHFHVPIHREVVGAVGTTRGFLQGALAQLVAAGRPLPQLEVETYTWSVLPDQERPDGPGALIAGIAAELAWARAELGA